MIVTAAHVLINADISEISNQSFRENLKLSNNHFFDPKVVCISDSYRPKATSSGSDYAFIFGKSIGRPLPPLKLSNKSEVANVVEFSGHTPNVIPTPVLTKIGTSIFVRAPLWTGASGSLAFDNFGNVLGVFVASTKFDNTRIGIVEALKRNEFLTKGSLDASKLVSNHKCFSYDLNRFLSVSDIEEWNNLVFELDSDETKRVSSVY